MKIVLKKGTITAAISTQGAQLRSLRKDGREYLWPGDEKLWADSCLTLFPFIGRCGENAYYLEGARYEMGLHGFAHKTDFQVEAQGETSCTLVMTDTEQTRKDYPFSFAFRVVYTLDEEGIRVEYRTENRGEKPMCFSVGGHPGFQLDLPCNQLTDYYVEFESGAAPVQKEIVTLCMRTGSQRAVSLEENRLWITPEMFTASAMVMEKAGDAVWLGCRNGGRILKLEKKGFPYFTLWQTLKTGAPFLCLEPWSSMPGRHDRAEDLETREDILWAQSGETVTKGWSVQLI